MPQTTSLIYTFERALEMMDVDGIRERKPVFVWMEGAEAHSKEPTTEELTWFHYIAVVNHCMGFTYFGGVPVSKHARATILKLDKELKAIQPFLFTFEDDPVITFENKQNEELIRVLAKKLGCRSNMVLLNNTSYYDFTRAMGIDSHINPRSVTISKVLQHVRRGRVRQVHSVQNGAAEVILEMKMAFFRILLVHHIITYLWSSLQPKETVLSRESLVLSQKKSQKKMLGSESNVLVYES